jgi:hypothetical protein
MVNHLVLHYFPVVLALFLFELVRLVLAEFPLLLVNQKLYFKTQLFSGSLFASPALLVYCSISGFPDKNTLVPFKKGYRNIISKLSSSIPSRLFLF